MIDAEYCPSHCAKNGTWQEPKWCLRPPYCCETAFHVLECCDDEAQRVGSVQNDYNCQRNISLLEHWRIILGACLSVAFLSLLGFTILCSLQLRRDKLRRARRARSPVSRSSSGASTATTLSGSSSRWSSLEGGPDVTEQNFHIDLEPHPIDTFMPTLQVCISEHPPSYRASGTRRGVTNQQEMSVGSQRGMQDPILKPIITKPPPYTADTPPLYTEIFP